MNQAIIDKVVRMATYNAMHGCPLRRIINIPPCSGTDNPLGSFILEYEPPCSSATRLPSWE